MENLGQRRGKKFNKYISGESDNSADFLAYDVGDENTGNNAYGTGGAYGGVNSAANSRHYAERPLAPVKTRANMVADAGIADDGSATSEKRRAASDSGENLGIIRKSRKGTKNKPSSAPKRFAWRNSENTQTNASCAPKITKETILKYLLFSAVIVVASGARVLGLMPFGIGLFISMCFVGLCPLVLAPVYMASSLLYSFSPYTLLGSGVVSVIFVAVWVLKKYKNIPEYVYYIAAPFSLAGFIPLINSEPLALLLFVFFVPVFVYVGQSFFYPLLRRGLRHRLLDSELICGGIILCVLALGLARMEIYYFPIIAIFAAFAILFSAKIYGLSGALCVGLCFGIGHAIFDYQIIWLAYYPVMALLATIFIPTPRIISAVAILIGFTLITFFFNLESSYAYLWLAALLAGGLPYVLMPKKLLNSIKNTLNPDYNPAGLRYNINLLRESTARSVFRTGEVFDEMSRFLTSGDKYALNIDALVLRVRDEVCAGCGKKCSVKREDISTLIGVSVEKGRASIVDLPAEILESCKFSAAMIASAASISEEYHKKIEKKESEEVAKSIVSEHLRGVGEVLREMSDSLSPPVSFDFEMEKKIKEELCYRGVFCYDAVLSPSAVTLVVAEEKYNRAEIERILKKVTRCSYTIESEEQGSTGLVVYAPITPVFDVAFSVGGVAKAEVSGDTHSFIKIGNDRFLMALCDGMGSGKTAEKYSSDAISLIECFYKAGFDHAAVIKNVNRFLSLSGDEAFTASDICVLDLSSGVADIFKIGSPTCFIKSAENVRAIEGSSLPIGALSEISPSVSQAALASGDMIVLVSDGIADCFEGDTLAAEISCASDISPKALCDSILSASKLKVRGKVRDDMTVVALRVFENI